MSCDVLRAVSKSDGEVLQAFHSDIMTRLAVAQLHNELVPCVEQIKQAVTDIVAFASENSNSLPVAAREFAYSIARIYMGEYKFGVNGHIN